MWNVSDLPLYLRQPRSGEVAPGNSKEVAAALSQALRNSLERMSSSEMHLRSTDF
ncbi:hypothetical protein ZEAMMB73_Zm00001d051794 [Zea mays]|uniref:Uncharacterized protein n=1 Tax=Zea mays TaxID=4577 RepID=A0A1D6Q9T7_MAIZE|nr:hypothetical protein ZEAMMB73_Zm00001d051794 [Zea mays]